jgi:hypothetical protein
VDAVTDRGLASLELPTTYPLDARGKVIPHTTCQPLSQRAWDAGEPGIACRSAAGTAPKDGEELALFARRHRLRGQSAKPFVDWFWSDDE